MTLESDVRRQWLARTRQLCNSQGVALVIYTVIMNVAVMAAMVVEIVFAMLTEGVGDLESLQQRAASGGWGYFAAIAIGMVCLLAWKKKDFCFRTVWQRGRPMKPGSLLGIGAVFVSVQLALVVFSVLWEQLLALLGLEYSGMPEVSTDNWSMFLYVGLGAPIAEELLFRGLILRTLQPCGKKFAIFASAILFGVFHGNLIQGVYAFAVGVILGYVAMEYNMVWAMVLHMFNNLILADTLSRLGGLWGMGDALVWALVLCAAAVAAVVLLLRWKRIGEYLRDNQNDPLCWRAFFTSPGILAFLIMMLISAVVVELSLIGQ